MLIAALGANESGSLKSLERRLKAMQTAGLGKQENEGDFAAKTKEQQTKT